MVMMFKNNPGNLIGSNGRAFSRFGYKETVVGYRDAEGRRFLYPSTDLSGQKWVVKNGSDRIEEKGSCQHTMFGDQFNKFGDLIPADLSEHFIKSTDTILGFTKTVTYSCKQCPKFSNCYGRSWCRRQGGRKKLERELFPKTDIGQCLFCRRFGEVGVTVIRQEWLSVSCDLTLTRPVKEEDRFEARMSEDVEFVCLNCLSDYRSIVRAYKACLFLISEINKAAKGDNYVVKKTAGEVAAARKAATRHYITTYR